MKEEDHSDSSDDLSPKKMKTDYSNIVSDSEEVVEDDANPAQVPCSGKIKQGGLSKQVGDEEVQIDFIMDAVEELYESEA